MPTPSVQYSLLDAGGGAVTVSQFDCVDYLIAQDAMHAFTEQRTPDEADQIWVLQHQSTYTQGTACQQQPLAPSTVPLVKSDRGGQITYHGLGQVVMYPLLDLKRRKLGVKALVCALEESVIELLEAHDVEGHRRDDAPGVYVAGEKISALGLRVRRGKCYHGLSLNIDMDLTPFANIDPCGYVGLKATQLADHSMSQSPLELFHIGHDLVTRFCAKL